MTHLPYEIRADGRYLAVYARHNGDRLSHWRISEDPHDLARWQTVKTFDWNSPPVPSATVGRVIRTFSIVGGTPNLQLRPLDGGDPNILVSTDDGNTWSYGGKLFTGATVGYVHGT